MLEVLLGRVWIFLHLYHLDIIEPAPSRCSVHLSSSQKGPEGPLLRTTTYVSPRETAKGPGCRLCTHPRTMSAHPGPGGPGAQLARLTMSPEGSESKAGLQTAPVANALPHLTQPPLTSVKHVLNSLELLAFSPCSCGRESTSKERSLPLDLWPGFAP